MPGGDATGASARPDLVDRLTPSAPRSPANASSPPRSSQAAWRRDDHARRQEDAGVVARWGIYQRARALVDRRERFRRGGVPQPRAPAPRPSSSADRIQLLVPAHIILLLLLCDRHAAPIDCVGVGRGALPRHQPTSAVRDRESSRTIRPHPSALHTAVCGAGHPRRGPSTTRAAAGSACAAIAATHAYARSFRACV